MSVRSTIKLIVDGDVKGAKQALSETRSETGKTGNAFKDFGKAAAAGLATAGVAALGFAADTVKTFFGYEDSLTHLKTALKDANISYDSHAKAIQGVIDANIALGTKEDDTVDLLTKGVTATGSLSKATALLSEAQNVSVQYGKPLADSYSALIKGLEGQTRPLKQLGIDLPVVAGGAEKTKVAYEGLLKAQSDLQKVQEDANTTDENHTIKNAKTLADDKQKLTDAEQRYTDAKKHTLSQLQDIQRAQQKVSDDEHADANSSVVDDAKIAAAKERVTTAQQKLHDVSTSGATILAAVNARTVGAAGAQAATAEGQIKAAQAKVDELKREIGSDVVSFLARDFLPFLTKVGTGELEFAHDTKNDVIDPLIRAWKEADHLYQSLTSALGLDSGAHDDTNAIYAANDKRMGWAPGTTARKITNDKQAPEGMSGQQPVIGTGGTLDQLGRTPTTYGDSPGHLAGPPSPQQAIDAANALRYIASLAYGDSPGHKPGPPVPNVVINMHAQPTPSMVSATIDRHVKRNGKPSTKYTATAP